MNIRFHDQPFSGHFPESRDEQVYTFSTAINYNEDLDIAILSDRLDIDRLASQDSFITNFEPEAHLDSLCQTLLSLDLNLSRIIGLSFKDRSLIRRIIIANPTSEFYVLDHEQDYSVPQSNSIALIQSLLSPQILQSSNNIKGSYNLIIARHILEHVYSLDEFFNLIDCILASDGILLIEIPDSTRLVLSGNPALFWEEHIYYLDQNGLISLLRKYGFKTEIIKTYRYALEDSIVVLAQKHTEPHSIVSIESQSILRNAYDLYELKMADFYSRLNSSRLFNKLAIFGAGHMAITLIANNRTINPFLVIDENPDKCGRFLPTNSNIPNIPIKSFSQATEMLNSTDVIVTSNPASSHHVKNLFSEFCNDKKINLIFPA
jgi:hypothetical protein